MSKTDKKVFLPEVIVFAGPNGSGKTTITKMANTKGLYINADDVKKASLCSDLEAAIKADELRNNAVNNHLDFTFETVLSTRRNIDLLYKAKKEGYFIRCFYILTAKPQINIIRIRTRVQLGGHSVPEDKIVKRYNKALKLLPELISICDIIHIYDNTKDPYRIFKKRKNEFYYWENNYWNKNQIENLTGIIF